MTLGGFYKHFPSGRRMRWWRKRRRHAFNSVERVIRATSMPRKFRISSCGL